MMKAEWVFLRIMLYIYIYIYNKKRHRPRGSVGRGCGSSLTAVSLGWAELHSPHLPITPPSRNVFLPSPPRTLWSSTLPPSLPSCQRNVRHTCTCASYARTWSSCFIFFKKKSKDGVDNDDGHDDDDDDDDDIKTITTQKRIFQFWS